MRVSRDKVNKVGARARPTPSPIWMKWIFSRTAIPSDWKSRKILEDLLNQEERIDFAARQKIENQKRTILEGSQEWDILYRKYYNEEVKKLGV